MQSLSISYKRHRFPPEIIAHASEIPPRCHVCWIKLIAPSTSF